MLQYDIFCDIGDIHPTISNSDQQRFLFCSKLWKKSGVLPTVRSWQRRSWSINVACILPSPGTTLGIGAVRSSWNTSICFRWSRPKLAILLLFLSIYFIGYLQLADVSDVNFLFPEDATFRIFQEQLSSTANALFSLGFWQPLDEASVWQHALSPTSSQRTTWILIGVSPSFL